jgi:hypothetical protein
MPAVVDFGEAATVRAHRQHVLATATAHPERFVKGRPPPADLPQAVWINPPAKKTTAQDAPGSTIASSDDLFGVSMSVTASRNAELPSAT